MRLDFRERRIASLKTRSQCSCIKKYTALARSFLPRTSSFRISPVRQWQNKKSLFTPLLLAISLHTICFLGLAAEWAISEDQAGLSTAALDQVYLYSVKENNNRYRGKDEKTAYPEKAENQSEKRNLLPVKGLFSSSNQTKQSDSNHPQSDLALAGSHSPEEKGDSELLRMIHNKVQEHQYYPAEALSLSQSGTVWLQFIVNSDGRIEQIHLLQSSGVKSLDEAGINALEAASPLPIDRRQLSASTGFTIHLVYAGR